MTTYPRHTRYNVTTELLIVALVLILALMLFASSNLTLFEDGSFTGCLPWALCAIN